MSKGKLLSGIIVGAAAGAVLGILLAPDKGSETRKKIAQKGTDLSDNVKDGFGKISDSISEKYKNVKGDAKDLMEKAKENGAEVKENFEQQKSF